MMETVIRTTLFCLIGAAAALMLKKATPELSFALTAAVVASVCLCLVSGLHTLSVFLRELESICGIPEALFLPLYKTAGIALIVKIGGSLCKDAEEYAMEASIETAGALCAFLAALPLFREVLNTVLELLV